ncbi:MAG: tetratricopeptide repeat protein [Myxococcales bacterium]
MNSDPVSARCARMLRFLLLCLLVLVSFPGGVGAQAKDEAAYKELIDQALTEFKLKNWPEARVLFRRAHELNPNARTLRGLGVVSFEMRDYQQAVQHLSYALVDTRQPLTDAQRSECEGLLGRARTFVGSYSLHLTPATALATLDGAPLVRDHDGLVLVPFGDHTLKASADRFQDGTVRIQVQGGERSDLNLALAAVGEAPVPVAVVAAAPMNPEPMTSGSATAVTSGPQPQPVEAPAERSFRGGGLRYSYVAMGAGLVFGGAAVAFWYLGQNKLDDLSARCERQAASGSPCQRGDTNTDSVKTYEKLTNASLGLAVAGAVATGVLVALEWPREKNLSVNVGLQSVSLRGSF